MLSLIFYFIDKLYSMGNFAKKQPPKQESDFDLSKAELEFVIKLISNADIRIKGSETQMLYNVLYKLQELHANK